MTALERLREEVSRMEELLSRVANDTGCDLYGAKRHFDRVNAALKAVEDEARWVPVEEGPPKSDDLILVVTDEKKVLRARYLRKQDLENIEWEIDGILEEGFYEDCEYDESFWEIYDVTHWRPLPEHPRKKEERK